MNLTLIGGQSDVTINGLNKTDSITQSTFDGITVTLTGAEINNLDDLQISGGAAEGKIGVRRIIWNGKIDGIDRNAVLIIDNVTSGKVRGVWLIFGEKENRLDLLHGTCAALGGFNGRRNRRQSRYQFAIRR